MSTSLAAAPGRARLLWLIAAGLVIGLNLAALGARLGRVAPLNPWEPALVCDAWRAAHGRAVYADPLLDHATVMYGPLWPHLLGGLVRVGLPADLRLPRAAVLLAAAGLVFLLARATRRPGSPPLAGLALLLAPSFPCASYYVEARPDLPALLAAAAALLCLWRGETGRRRAVWAWGLGLLVLAGSLKQTMLAAGAVPLVAVIVERRPLRAALGWVLPPLGLVLALPPLLRLLAPQVYHYAFAVPAAYPLEPGPAALALLEGASRAPLPLALLALQLLRPRRSAPPGWGRRPAPPGWGLALAAALVAWPLGAVAATKPGGDANSHLPLLLSGAAYALLRLPAVWPRAAGRPLLAGLLAGLLLLGALREPVRSWRFAFHAAHGDATRPAAIEALRGRPGPGACPDDPALLLAATGEPGRSLIAEKDADGWRRRVPPGVVEELRRARWVVTVHGTWPLSLPPPLLRELGFAPGPLPGTSPAYVLWARAE